MLQIIMHNMHSAVRSNAKLLLTARPSTDSMELEPFSSFFEGFVEELDSAIIVQRLVHIQRYQLPIHVYHS